MPDKPIPLAGLVLNTSCSGSEPNRKSYRYSDKDDIWHAAVFEENRYGSGNSSIYIPVKFGTVDLPEESEDQMDLLSPLEMFGGNGSNLVYYRAKHNYREEIRRILPSSPVLSCFYKLCDEKEQIAAIIEFLPFFATQRNLRGISPYYDTFEQDPDKKRQKDSFDEPSNIFFKSSSKKMEKIDRMGVIMKMSLQIEVGSKIEKLLNISLKPNLVLDGPQPTNIGQFTIGEINISSISKSDISERGMFSRRISLCKDDKRTPLDLAYFKKVGNVYEMSTNLADLIPLPLPESQSTTRLL